MTNTDHIRRYWGKATPPSGSAISWHPLAYHSLDVTACVEALLLARPAWIRLLCALLGPGVTSEQAMALALRLAAVHDIGKFGSFQKQSKEATDEIGIEPFDGPTSGIWRHDNVGLALLMDDMLISDVLGGDLEDDTWSRMLASASACHHGRPTDENLVALVAVIGRTGMAAVRRYVDGVLDLFADDPGLPKTLEAARRVSLVLAALINLADWLGSNPHFFGYTRPEHTLAGYWPMARKAAARAVREAGLVEPRPPGAVSFEKLYPNIAVPSPLQAEAAALSFPEGQFLMLIDEAAGGGKTEAVMTLVARLIYEGKASGLFLGLPTTATANQQKDRQRAVYRLLFNEEEDPSLTLAHSGAGAGLVRDPDEDRRLWLADDRRTRMMANVCVGTVDQALLAALPAKFAALRLCGLLGKVLVVDEAHSYDPYTSFLLRSLVSLHAALGGSVILLSATMPTHLKADMACAFASAANLPPPDPKKNAATAYPLITVVSGEGTALVEPAAAPNAPPDKAIRFVRSKTDALKAAVQAARSGLCVAWVRNTVDQVIESGKTLDTMHNDVTVLHSRFLEADLTRLTEGVLHRFGPKGEAADRRGAIVVATAIIEQSLDLDFDLMIVDLKPMEGVIQSLGRARRHRRDAHGNPIKVGPDQRAPIPMIVFAPDPHGEVAFNWYGQVLGKAAAVHRDPARLWRTAAILEEEGGIFYGRMRAIVDRSYDDDALPAPSALLRGEDKAEIEANKQMARAKNLVQHWGADVGYIHTGKVWDDEHVPTRDGASLEVIFVREDGGILAPYDGGNWLSGRMKLRPGQAEKLRAVEEVDLKGAQARHVCGKTRLIAGHTRGDNLEAPGFCLTGRWGLEFLGLDF